MEVNWNDKDAKSNESKIVKFIWPDGNTTLVKREHLMGVLFALGTPEQQRKMIPQTMSKVRWYETVLTVKASKDVRKGEDLTFPVKLSLPPIEEEVIQELGKNLTES